MRALGVEAMAPILDDLGTLVRVTRCCGGTQGAYKGHKLYVLEKHLTKYQTLRPRGPILGMVSGIPIFPRSCVQVLHAGGQHLRNASQARYAFCVDAMHEKLQDAPRSHSSKHHW